MGGDTLTIDQMEELSRLPARDVLHGQLVGMIASPITGLVRGLNALISGLAIQLGQIRDQGLVGGDEPAAEAPAEEPAEEPGGGSGRGARAEEAPAEEPADEASPEPEGDGTETDETDTPSEGDETE